MVRPLSQKKCVPCTSSTRPLPASRASKLLEQVPGWSLTRRGRLKRKVRFEDFLTLMEFVNDMAQVAEEQQHHPDFSVHHAVLDIEIWTHVAGGLTENDFILAARLNEMLGDRS